jgi:hypothetical protein
MTTSPHNSKNRAFTPQSAEETLRIVANLPAPAGLEDRVHAALRVAPRRGRVLAWPEGFRPQSGWMRTAAAAAIVFVVAGGGWGVYTRVEQNRPAKVLVMPRVAAPGGFSGASAVRTPQTLTGPTVAPLPVQSTTLPQSAQPKTAKKPAAKASAKTAESNGAPNHAAQQQ